ncbi:MAG: hypothetical protein EB120_02960 [Proteobacteria bacterium]|nr:hypothetical protein [Pseudomonadota bacterium]NDC23105.1 hypothetical protein [Pseudomonadota bacterium]NDG26120.1 hypothetical protein [Pseudomonadota bacterium]
MYFQNPKPLISIAESLISITPKVFVVEEDIYADISPTEKLFGGEQRLIQKVETLLDLFQTHPPWVVTEKINWAKALCIREKNILKPGESQALLLSLPIDSLVCCGNPLLIKNEEKARVELVAFLKKLGLHFCSDFLKIPPASISRRFGKLGVSLLHSLQGENEPALPLFEPNEPIRFSIETESLFSLESLLFEIERVLPLLEARLQGRHTLIQQMNLSFFLENKTQLNTLITFSPMTREPAVILRVLSECLNQMQWSSPLRHFSVQITESITTSASQLNLLDNTEERFQELGDYVYRMRLRFGERNVGFPLLQSTYLPESSWTLIWPPQENAFVYPPHKRPLFLFSNPFPFDLNRQWSLTELEHLNLDWWKTSIHRHYFLATHQQGEKLWVFWDLQKKKWFCHGCFD